MGREKLISKLNNFINNYNAEQINNYFASHFGDEWDSFIMDSTIGDNTESVLEYLNDSFIDIDIKYRESKDFDNKVKSVLKNAINMLSSTK